MVSIKFTNEEQTKKIIENITNKYEPPGSPAAFNKLPEEYVDRLVKAIIGFTIEVSTIENVFKLSQNHDAITRESIIENLLSRHDAGSHAIAMEMKSRCKLNYYMTRQQLINHIKQKKSYLCVGLDTSIEKIPVHLTGQILMQFLNLINKSLMQQKIYVLLIKSIRLFMKQWV